MPASETQSAAAGAAIVAMFIFSASFEAAKMNMPNT